MRLLHLPRPIGGTTRVPWRRAVIPAALIAAALAVMLPAPVDAGARLRQHLMSLVVQLGAAAWAAVALLQASRTYARGDRERWVWLGLTAGSALWVVGLVVYAAAEWSGAPTPYPSIADLFFVTAFVALGGALVVEWPLAGSILTSRQRRLLGAGSALLWALVVIRFVWPMVVSPLGPLEKALDLFYAGIAAALLPAALVPAVAFRGGLVGYVWTGIAAGLVCLATAGFGFAYLAWYGLYSAVHPINVVRVLGFALLAMSAAWYRRAMETV